jgi:hypothetical protein
MTGGLSRSSALRLETERTLSPDEAREYLAAPVSDRERETVLELVEWFRRRYPTPLARLAYVRKAYARWQAPTQP